jgi:hypothetical protein
MKMKTRRINFLLVLEENESLAGDESKDSFRLLNSDSSEVGIIEDYVLNRTNFRMKNESAR